MAVDTSADITTDYLESKAHDDLLETYDDEGKSTVTTFLESALDVVQSFMMQHNKHVIEPPGVIFNPKTSGVRYDPYHRQGERLIFGGPRGILRGGYQYLSHHDYLTSPSLLTILSNGLIHAYDQQLAVEYFDSHDIRPGRDTPTIRLYDEYEMLAAGADEAFAQMFSLYTEADLTDKSLREGYIDEWAAWHNRRGEIDTNLFTAVAYTISERVEAASGDAKDCIVDGLSVQEPLVRDGQLSVLHKQLNTIE